MNFRIGWMVQYDERMVHVDVVHERDTITKTPLKVIYHSINVYDDHRHHQQNGPYVYLLGFSYIWYVYIIALRSCRKLCMSFDI